jgi:hypothetical protein
VSVPQPAYEQFAGLVVAQAAEIEGLKAVIAEHPGSTLSQIDDGCGSVEVSCVGWIYPANA